MEVELGLFQPLFIRHDNVMPCWLNEITRQNTSTGPRYQTGTNVGNTNRCQIPANRKELFCVKNET